MTDRPQSPRTATCATPTCGLPIRYVTGPTYGRWIHDHDGRWQCADYGPGEAKNNQANPGTDYYRNTVRVAISPLHRDGDFDGRDIKGRLAGPDAVQRLLNTVPVGPDWSDGAPANLFDAADDVISEAVGLADLKNAALRYLLALHMQDRLSRRPQVAARNIQEGDVIEVAGQARTVTQKLGDGRNGATVNIYTSGPDDGAGRLVAHSGDTHIPLLHRVSTAKTQELLTAIVDAAQSGDSRYTGLFDAFVMLTGTDEDRLHDEVQHALQVRHEEMIAAEELH